MTAASVFIVEDEIITAQGIAKNLRHLGYQIAGIATSGSSAIAKVAKLKPDVVLMDIRLKKNDIDGIAAANEIKKKYHIPVIYLTAHSDKATLERAKITEPFGYILKPYNQKDLQISLTMALYKYKREKKLVEREQLLSNILNATADGVVAINKTGKIIYLNPAASHLTGWEIEEAFGQQVTDVVQILDESQNNSILDPIQQVLEEGKVVYLDDYMALIAKDGRKISIGDSISPIWKEPNNVDGAVLIFSDLSQSQRRQKLKQEVAQSQKLLAEERKLKELKSCFLRMLAHELRIPLTVVLTSVESLRCYRQRWTEEKQLNYFERISKAIQQMTQLLNDVSLWEQAETKKLPFNPVSLDAIAFCEQLIEELKNTDQDNHEFVLAYTGNRSHVWLDLNLLRYILTNLLANAIKYSPQQSTIQLSLSYQEQEIIFQVSDRGIGIPQAELKYLFDSFYRATNVDNIPGTGLGLAIIKSCVELHQGNIEVESEVGAFSQFTVSLPTYSDPV